MFDSWRWKDRHNEYVLLFLPQANTHQPVPVLTVPPSYSTHGGCCQDTDEDNDDQGGAVVILRCGASREGELGHGCIEGSGYPSGFVHKHTTSNERREEVEDQKPRF